MLSKKEIYDILSIQNIKPTKNIEWLQIKNFNKYLASSLGKIFNIKKSHYVPIIKTKSGYCIVKLYYNNSIKSKQFFLHELLAELFTSRKDDTVDVEWNIVHIDNNKDNNCVDNLKWKKMYKPSIKNLSLKGEIWKDIKDCPNYKISNFGRFINVKYMNILKYKPRKDGYVLAQITHSDGTRKGSLVHRLVCEAFIDNPNNYKIVNHKNGIKHDNKESNLEWSTYSNNTKHAYETGLMKRFKPKRMIKGKPILQLSLDGTLIKEYPSIKVATKEIGYKNKYRISDAVQGRSNTTGYIWHYKKLEDLSGEIWKPVNLKNYEHYQVSNLGRLKNKDCNLLHPGNTHGYYRVILSNNKRKIGIYIHQLVALTFIDNPNKCRVVNHKDSNKLNNKADNIEWCTHSQNTLHYHKNKNKN